MFFSKINDLEKKQAGILIFFALPVPCPAKNARRASTRSSASILANLDRRPAPDLASWSPCHARRNYRIKASGLAVTEFSKSEADEKAAAEAVVISNWTMEKLQ